MSLHIHTIFALATHTSIPASIAQTMAPSTPTATPAITTPSPISQPHGPLPNPEQIVPTATLNFAAQILISIIILLISLAIGLYFHRRLQAYLKKTILDHWFTRMLGVLAVLIPVIAGGITTLSVWQNLGTLFHNLDTRYGINVYALGGQLLITLILIVFGIGMARTIQALTLRGLSEKRIDINLRTFISRVIYFILVIVVGLWILSIWNIPLGIPATAIGILSVVISFAIQDILKDLVAGFYILIERPFFIGDQISVTIAPTVSYVGKVLDINLRATRVRLLGGEEISIPNAILFGGVVANNTHFSERRAAISATLPTIDFTFEDTKKRILSSVAEISMVMSQPEPTVIVSKYTEDKVTLLVRFWIASDHTIDLSEVMLTLHTLLPPSELTIVEPIGGV